MGVYRYKWICLFDYITVYIGKYRYINVYCILTDIYIGINEYVYVCMHVCVCVCL